MKRHLKCTEQQASSSNFTNATKNESQDWSCSHMKLHVQSAEQQHWPSNLSKYCACHAKWISWFILLTYETSFTMRGATGLILQPHQILRPPSKMTRMIDPAHKWNVMTMRGSTALTLQPHQILRLPRKMTCQNMKKMYWKQLKRHLQCAADSTMIRAWNCKTEPARSASLLFRPINAFCIENYNISRSGYLSTFHRILRWRQKWQSKITKCCACHEKWHFDITKYCACHEKRHCNIAKCYACLSSDTPTSPNSVPATGLVSLLNCYCAELLLYWAVTLLSCDVTELLFYWTVTLLFFFWTVTFLNC